MNQWRGRSWRFQNVNATHHLVEITEDNEAAALRTSSQAKSSGVQHAISDGYRRGGNQH